MKLTIEVSDQIVRYVQSSCDIAYWANSRHAPPTKRGDAYVQVREQDRGDGKPGRWVTLTDARMRQAFARMASVNPYQFGEALRGQMDSTTGDVLVQIAVLGEEKYG